MHTPVFLTSIRHVVEPNQVNQQTSEDSNANVAFWTTPRPQIPLQILSVCRIRQAYSKVACKCAMAQTCDGWWCKRTSKLCSRSIQMSGSAVAVSTPSRRTNTATPGSIYPSIPPRMGKHFSRVQRVQQHCSKLPNNGKVREWHYSPPVNLHRLIRTPFRRNIWSRVRD